MKSETIGYIVVDTGKYGTAMCEEAYFETPKTHVLLHGDFATLFPTYSAAKKAIERSKKYSDLRNYGWNTWDYKPMRVMGRK